MNVSDKGSKRWKRTKMDFFIFFRAEKIHILIYRVNFTSLFPPFFSLFFHTPNNIDTYLGLYGNDDLHNGLLEVWTSGRKVDYIISSVRNQTQSLESTLANRIRPQLVELADIFDQPASNQSALSTLILSLQMVQGNVSVAKNAAADIRKPLMQVTISSFLWVS